MVEAHKGQLIQLHLHFISIVLFLQLLQFHCTLPLYVLLPLCTPQISFLSSICQGVASLWSLTVHPKATAHTTPVSILALECHPMMSTDLNARAWQIILKDSRIILFYSSIPKFSAHYSFKPAHYSSIILKQHHAASAKFICHDLCF